VLIDLNSMTPNFLIGKLVIIEEDPYKIWRSLEENYGPGYFNCVMENVLGIDTSYKDKLYQEFRKKLLETNHENENQLYKMKKELSQEINILKNLLEEQRSKITSIIEEYNDLLIERAEKFEKSMSIKQQDALNKSVAIYKERLERC
jgi:DNA anti-recombination protein RmuC